MVKFLFTLAVFLIVTLVYGQDHPQTLLWKVTKKGNKNQSYLFGTFHEVSPAFFNSLANAVSKLNESDILFVEQQIAPVQHFTVQNKSFWNFERWQTVLTKEQQNIFQEFVEKIADTSCYTQSPFELLLGITRFYLQTVCETDTGLSDLMDNYIEKLALKENKRVYSLDRNQQAIINSTSEKSNKQQDILYAANCIVGMKTTLDRDLAGCEFITAYQNLDVDYKLDTNLNQNAVDKPLLIDRNRNWSVILDKAFSSSNCFVAVGFRHLCYKEGLIQQLRKSGYEVTPIPARL